MADFHSKMNVCRHELGGSTPTPDNSNPAKIAGSQKEVEKWKAICPSIQAVKSKSGVLLYF